MHKEDRRQSNNFTIRAVRTGPLNDFPVGIQFIWFTQFYFWGEEEKEALFLLVGLCCAKQQLIRVRLS